jgi:SAM-dependent methyltransferase
MRAAASVPTVPRSNRGPDSSQAQYTRERIDHWDAVARTLERVPVCARYYHRQLQHVYQFLVPPGQSVLEIGCARGDVLAAVRPTRGVGVDFSPEMLRQARSRHPHLTFLEGDAHQLPGTGPFDVVILSDLVNDLWDVEHVLRQLRPLLTPRSRVILNFFSRLWQLPLELGRRLGVITPMLPQNWLTNEDLVNLLHLTDFELVRRWGEILCPVGVPGLAGLCNRFLARLWPFNQGVLANFLIARPAPARETAAEPKVSVIVPARNESGNIAAVFDRLPRLGRETELVFVEGHSTDDTFDRIAREIDAHPEWPCQLHRQAGKGKGDAVRLGFARATGDVLMILDADLTVPPEDLPRFYRALVCGKGEFVNGVRLVYPMQKRAMRFLNLVGNKFFSLAFSWLLGQPVKDTLCGTKALWRRDYELIAANRHYFGDFDPFGDFDLLFGAARLNRKIIDLPIRYRERSYGTTNIRRWKHGWLLLRMVAFAARRIKFV